jgi:hypothetical protein
VSKSFFLATHSYPSCFTLMGDNKRESERAKNN